MIAIGITTWNGLEHTKACIESLKNVTIPYELLIWDNASTDGTVEYLYKVEGNKTFCYENLGMVIPWNWQLKMGFANPKVTHVWICNNDIKFLQSTQNIQDCEGYGLICPAILPNVKGNLEAAAQLYHLFKEYPFEEGLNGPLMCISREAYEKVGLFDERLKNSFNDMDYHQRVIKAGLKAGVYNESWIWHYGGASTSKNPDCHNPEYLKLFREKH
jgi:GT2 family glycosyltransferase